MKTLLTWATALLVASSLLCGIVAAEEVDIETNNNSTNSTGGVIDDDPSLCVSSVQEFDERLAAPRESATEIRTVTICPNTCLIYDALEPGQRTGRLFLTNANTHIMCGESGELQNNCTLAVNSPTEPVATILVLQTGSDVFNNMKVSGVTFDGLSQRGWAGTLAFEGFLAFDNCVFQNYEIVKDGLLVFVANQGQTDVYFNDCVFRNNKLASDHLGQGALVWMNSLTNHATFNGSQFFDNELVFSAEPPITVRCILPCVNVSSNKQKTGIFRVGPGKETSITVQNCCFGENTFTGPLFAVEESAAVGAMSDNFVAASSSTGCTLLEFGTTCIESDLDACPIEPALASLQTDTMLMDSCPEISPRNVSDAPTASPTDAPTPKSSSHLVSAGYFTLFALVLLTIAAR